MTASYRIFNVTPRRRHAVAVALRFHRPGGGAHEA